MSKPLSGGWMPFAQGEYADSQGGAPLLRLATVPVSTRFVRIWMTESSNTCDTHGAGDPRNCVGFAVNEVSAGTFSRDGKFVDLVKHIAGENQTITLVSSIDPWHSEADLDSHAIQTGFDLFFSSGYTNHLPAMIPVSMLYGTPGDSAAELAYLRKRGYAISYVEMGEEPDGQNMLPEDYAALYLQWATALHKVDAQVKLGGPVFEGVNDDIKVWPDANGKTSWLGRFVDYLKAHNHLSDLSFVSRALSNCALRCELERPVPRAGVDANRFAGLARRRRSGRYSVDEHRKQSVLEFDGADAGCFCRAVAGR